MDQAGGLIKGAEALTFAQHAHLMCAWQVGTYSRGCCHDAGRMAAGLEEA
jgi:hypothetical protein